MCCLSSVSYRVMKYQPTAMQQITHFSEKQNISAKEEIDKIAITQMLLNSKCIDMLVLNNECG